MTDFPDQLWRAAAAKLADTCDQQRVAELCRTLYRSCAQERNVDILMALIMLTGTFLDFAEKQGSGPSVSSEALADAVHQMIDNVRRQGSPLN